jgi:HlyD family secretion protein
MTSPRDGRHYYEVEVELELRDNEKLLLVGGLANCDIHVETMVDVLKVPSQAVVDRRIDELPASVTAGVQGIGRNRAFARVVYKVINGEAVAVPVVAGSSDLRSTVVLQGLDPGDRIVTGPYKVLATLKHGQKVEVDGPAATPGDRPAGGVAQSSPAPGAGAN